MLVKIVKMRALFCLLVLLGLSKATPIGKVEDLRDLNLPSIDPYQPEPLPKIPIELGRRRKF